MRLIILSILLLVIAGATHAQQNKKVTSVGVSYSVTPYDKSYAYDQGVGASYSSYIHKATVDIAYNLTDKFYMTSSVGAAYYDAKTEYTTGASPTSTSLDFSRLNLVLSQKIAYKLFSIGKEEPLRVDINPFEYRNMSTRNYLAFPIRFELSPMLGIEYHHHLKDLQNSRGFADLQAKEAGEWVSNYKLPALKSSLSNTLGMLYTSAGLNFNFTIYNKVALYYDLNYSIRLFGKHQMNIDYLYSDGAIYHNTYNMSRSSLQHTAGIRYCF